MQSVEPEREIVRRALPLGVAALAVASLAGLLISGSATAASAAIGASVVLANFAVNGYTLAWAAKVSPGFLGVVAAVGFVLRMAVIFGALLLLRSFSFFSTTAFVLAAVPLMLLLLGFETKLAFGPMGRRIDIPDEAAR